MYVHVGVGMMFSYAHNISHHKSKARCVKQRAVCVGADVTRAGVSVGLAGIAVGAVGASLFEEECPGRKASLLTIQTDRNIGV